ncbi:MAG TPA: 5-formyltetrahydrofolate cyclo-ligase [Pseudolysinimonas sp.]|nr:5-formyltetrahydrofolate cyclo-ligase [Pseudolysinimonas sp.]
MAAQIDEQKRALRAEIRARRSIRTQTQREQDAAGLTRHLAELVTRLHARTVTAYLSLPEEPPTRGFVAWAREEQIAVLVPVSREDGLLDWVRVGAEAGSPESQDWLGMPTASGDHLGPDALADADLMLIPAAAIDREGMRMGWGRGYFDRTLDAAATRPPAYAVIFDDELVETVPREAHDLPVDGVVTPTRIVTF